MKRKSKLTIAIATAALAALVATVVYAQNNDKYSGHRRAESHSPTSGDTRTGRWSPPPKPTKGSR